MTKEQQAEQLADELYDQLFPDLGTSNKKKNTCDRDIKCKEREYISKDGNNPQWLYDLLPNGAAGYHPYDATHVITQLEILLFSALAFTTGFFSVERIKAS